MARRLAELGGQERLHEVPGSAWADRAAPETDDVHVIVFDALLGREVIIDQRGPNSRNLVGADRDAHPAATESDPALDRACRHGLSERDDEVRIVVILVQLVRAEIDDVVAGRAQLRDHILLQGEPAVIGRDSYAHGDVSPRHVALATGFSQPPGGETL